MPDSLSDSCPRCEESVAPANIRCRNCGLPRTEFKSFDAENGERNESSDSDGFELGPSRPGTSSHFQLPPMAAAADSGHSMDSVSSSIDLDNAPKQLARSGGEDRRKELTESQFSIDSSNAVQRAGANSDPDVQSVESSKSVSGSGSRVTLAVSCESCGTVNHLPKTLAKSGVRCSRCGRPLVASGDSSGSANGSVSGLDSRIQSLAGKDRRKHLKRAIEKALAASPPDRGNIKYAKSLSTKEWKELKGAIEEARNAECPQPTLTAGIEALEEAINSADKRAVTYLVANCEDFRDELRAVGKRGLGKLKTIDALSTLLQSLIEDIPEIFTDIAIGLGHLGDRRATRTLVTLGTYWESTRAPTIEALGLLGQPAIAELVSLVERRDKVSLRPVAIEALGTIGDAQAIPVLAGVIKNERRAEVRVASARALGRIEDRGVLGPLVASLKDDESCVRLAAVVALQNHPRKRIVPALVHVLNDPDAKVRENAARLLGNCGVAKAVTPLGLLAGDPVDETRIAVLEALAKLGDETAVPQLGFQLSEARGGDDQELVGKIADRLGGLKDVRATLPLLNAMPGSLPNVQGRLVAALGEIGDESVLPALVDVMTNGGTPAVRSAAVSAIGRLGINASVEPLARAITAGPPLKMAAVAALGDVKSEESIAVLADLLTDADANIRRRAVESMGKVGDESVLRRLRPLREDADNRVRDAAIDSLKQLGDVDATAEAPVKTKKEPKKKVKIKKKKAGPKFQMPDISMDRLKAIDMNELAYLAKSSPLIPGIAAAIVLLIGVGYFYAGSLGDAMSGKNSEIFSRGVAAGGVLSGDGKSIAISRSRNVIDVMTNRGGYILDERSPTGRGIAMSQDGKFVVSSSDKSGVVWNLDEKKSTKIDAFDYIATTVDRSLSVVVKRGKMRTISMADGSISELGTISLPGRISTFAINKDATQVLAGLLDGSVHVWSQAENDIVARFRIPETSVATLSYALDESKLLVGGGDGLLYVFEKGNSEPVLIVDTQPGVEAGLKATIGFAVFTSDQEAICVVRGKAKLVDLSTGNIAREFAVDPNLSLVTTSGDYSLLATANEESREVKVYTVATGEVAWTAPIE